MKIFLTFDYELFFGDNAGSATKCMLEPTADLLQIAKKTNVHYTFFVDVGYLIQAEKYPELSEELSHVKHQIQEMLSLKHDVQLHIHPHWEKAVFENGEWKMNVSGAYKLIDFEEVERNEIIHKYKTYLEQLVGRKVIAFRAGGWCIQPFSEFKDVFKAEGIKIDSSVIAGMQLITDDYYVDFTNAPRKSSYRFEDDVCVEDDEGSFIEYPISSYRYRPSFYWMLFGFGRLFPKRHKMIGDGTFLSQGERKINVLLSYTTMHVSTDGYYAKKLSPALEKSINMGHEEMVIIGHPKGNTIYSLEKMKQFIRANHTKHEFTTFHKHA